MHFAPQWVKPIKPTGSSATTPNAPEILPSALNPHPVKQTPAQSQVPFPALSSSNLASPVSTTGPGNLTPMSYSRATHAPQSPNVPTDGSYFPSDNNGASPNPHPFRYSREQIIAQFDEEKFKSTPIELVELLERGSVLVAPHVNRPIAMRELNETEKKLLSTTVHPAIQRRTQQQAPSTPSTTEPSSNGSTRRSGQASVTRDPTQPNGRGFGNFGRAEGGILSAGVGKAGVIGGGLVGTPGDVKAPGVLGGGFGGVGKRMARGRNDTPETVANGEGGRPWRATRTHSGNFEGVLGGFGGTQSATPSQPPVNEVEEPIQSSAEAPHTAPVAGGWRERMAAKQGQKKEPEDAGQPANAGWTNAQSKWRAPAGSDLQSSLDAPRSQDPSAASVIATPSATPLPDRDAMIDASTPVAENTPSQQQQTEADLAAVEWYYRVPSGEEHGPFTATQMHEWYASAYFTDDLPIKRASETSWHTLAELKQATGNAVRPFVSAVRPRPPPPSLPVPGMLPPHMMPIADSFRNLAVHPGFPNDPRMAMGQQGGIPPFAPPFRNDAPFSPGQYGPQQGFLPGHLGSPGFIGSPGQSWAGVPGAGSRFNGVGGFGSPVGPGMGSLPGHFPQQGAFSPAIGGPIGRAPDFFSPSIGAGAVPGSIPTSPWALPQQQHQQQPIHQMYQQQPQQPQDQIQHQPPMDQQWQQPQQPQQQSQAEESTQQDTQPSYFPPVQSEVTQSAPEPEQVEEQQQETEQAPEPVAEEQASVHEEEASEAVDVVEEPAASGPPPSVWGAVPTASRRSSLTPASNNVSLPPTPAVAKTPAPAAPAPTKPAAVRKESIAEQPVLAPAIATPERSTNTPKPAPWAVKDDKEVKTPSGPSLREIQEAEAKAAEARKQAIAEMRANNAVSSPAPSSTEDVITSMSWGLPAQNSKAPQVSSPSVASPSAPAWGAGDSAGPKKTMKQIQEEEEKRRAKLAQAKAQAQVSTPAAGASATKRGYADLAATSAPPSGSGWQTVGVTGKGVPGSGPATPAARPAAPAKSAVVAPPKPVVSTPVPRTIKANGGPSDDSTPSVDFVRWAKQSLNGLNVNIDEFIQMLLSFPIDPPASERAGQLEIISDSVYANSSTLDGRRFAQEFYTRRKADSKRSGPAANGSAVSKPTSLADVLKTQPKPQSSDLGFKIVKAKGKKKN